MKQKNLYIEIEFGKEKGKAILLDDVAPETCNKVWDSLPIESFANHVKIAGDEVMFRVPVIIPGVENPVKEQEPGNICYFDQRQTICMFYGNVPGIGAANMIAKVTENLKGLTDVARACWFKGGQKISIKKI